MIPALDAFFLNSNDARNLWNNKKKQIKLEDLKKPIQINDHCQIILPHDFLYCTEGEWKELQAGDMQEKNVKNEKNNISTYYNIAKLAEANNLPNDAIALDIGPASVKKICDFLEGARAVMWNGPAGYFENEAFAQGTMEIAQKIINLTRQKNKKSQNGFNNNEKNDKFSYFTSVVGGGDSLAAFQRLDFSGNILSIREKMLVKAEFSGQMAISYACTGGGAFLAWLENPALPGVEALRVG
jgi:3-phosphoglycerate kinase